MQSQQSNANNNGRCNKFSREDCSVTEIMLTPTASISTAQYKYTFSLGEKGQTSSLPIDPNSEIYQKIRCNPCNLRSIVKSAPLLVVFPDLGCHVRLLCASPFLHCALFLLIYFLPTYFCLWSGLIVQLDMMENLHHNKNNKNVC